MDSRSSPPSLNANRSPLVSWNTAACNTLRLKPTAQSPATATYIATDTEAEILDFIALLDLTNVNETGWTHETASLALEASRLSQSEGKRFDFFSHISPELWKHFRNTYDRRKRCGYTGDIPERPDMLSVSFADMGNVVSSIEAAIYTPAKRSKEQLARAKELQQMSKSNQVIDAIDDMFKPTLGSSLSDTESD